MYKNFQQCKDKLDGIQSIDFFLARLVCRSINKEVEDKKDDNLLFHSIMATSQALRNGHTCLKIDRESGKLNWTTNATDRETGNKGYLFPTTADWHKYLLECKIAPDNNHPLVYDYNRLYLRRYWQFEVELSTVIKKLIDKNFPLDINHGKKIIDQLFLQNSTPVNNSEPDWQKIAVANALGKQFTIIAGGPGTGKTYTVTKLLAALLALSDNHLKIAMVAPTGKAAQRLNESISKTKSLLQKQQLISQKTLQRIPDSASTLHRLLGVKTNSHNFHYNNEKKLPFDILLIDETSMIDLPLMCRLLRAIKKDCRVILLGDADQLPPVAAGSILADLMVKKITCYSQSNSQQLNKLTGFDIPIAKESYDYLTVLQKSHRFDGFGEIGQLARLVINGKAEPGWNLLQQAKKQITIVKHQAANLSIDNLIEQYYVPLFSSSLELTQAFECLNQFRFLVVTRSGGQGVSTINNYIEDYLLKNKYIKEAKEFYPGRPIMVAKNNYLVGLYNGDIGLLWLNGQGQLYAVFPESNDTDSFRWLSLGRLPAVETVYAMTIHKTQGSEFSHAALILPQYDSPVLSRELLYTGITRASSKLTIYSDKSIWELAVKRKIKRYSGLKQRFLGDKLTLS